MGDLKEWLKYWRKVISKCSKIHKDSRAHRRAYAELSGYLGNVEESANDGELDATGKRNRVTCSGKKGTFSTQRKRALITPVNLGPVNRP
jgi:hypothetical protein